MKKPLFLIVIYIFCVLLSACGKDPSTDAIDESVIKDESMDSTVDEPYPQGELIVDESFRDAVGASGKEAVPANPWGGGWEYVYNGLDRSTPLKIENKNNVLIINSNIHDVTGTQDAVEIKNSTKVWIFNNIVTGHEFEGHGSGIEIDQGSADIIIENNTISDCSGNGISTWGRSSECCPHDNPVPNCIIKDNLIHNVGKYADPVGNSPKHGMYIKAQEVLIENNIVHDVYDGSGLSIRSTGVVRGNTVFNCKDVNIAYWPQKEAGASELLVIENNVVYQDGSYPGPLENRNLINLGTTRPPKFQNFIVRFNSVIMFPDAARTTDLMSVASNYYENVEVYGNLVVDLRSSSPRYFKNEGESTYFEANYSTNDGQGFMDIEARDFRLAQGYRAINYAIGAKDFPSLDLRGLVRSAESLDAGAYEFNGF